jgi:hypothetical protein
MWKWIAALVGELCAEPHPGARVQIQMELSGQLDLDFQDRQVVELFREGDLVG